ncbi:MAG: DUF5677 domain-containing protein [Euzebya sp.]
MAPRAEVHTDAHRERLRGKQAAIEAVRGAALRRVLAHFLASAQAAQNFGAHRQQAAEAEDDQTYHVLAGLHSGALPAALEIHHLLSSGFLAGATARQWYIHEAAAVAYVVGSHRRDDIAQRFIDHYQVDRLDWLGKSHEHGLSGVTQDDIDLSQRVVESLIAKYGRAFRRPYGWMAPPCAQGHSPGMGELERLAGLTRSQADVSSAASGNGY